MVDRLLKYARNSLQQRGETITRKLKQIRSTAPFDLPIDTLINTFAELSNKNYNQFVRQFEKNSITMKELQKMLKNKYQEIGAVPDLPIPAVGRTESVFNRVQLLLAAHNGRKKLSSESALLNKVENFLHEAGEDTINIRFSVYTMLSTDGIQNDSPTVVTDVLHETAFNGKVKIDYQSPDPDCTDYSSNVLNEPTWKDLTIQANRLARCTGQMKPFFEGASFKTNNEGVNRAQLSLSS